MSPRRNAARPRAAALLPCCQVVVALALAACGDPIEPLTDGRAADARASDARAPDARADGALGDAAPPGDVPALPDGATASDASADGAPEVDAGDPFDRSHCAMAPDMPGTTRRTITTRSGAMMTYVAFVPSTYAMRTPAPVVLALHGAGDTAGNYLSVVWQGPAQMRNALVVAPEGSCPLGPGNTFCRDDPNGALDALNDFEQCYSVDRRRRIINGFSAGGILAYAIGLQAAPAFAGISITAADLGSAEALSGRALLPAPWTIPLSQFHGTLDMNFPITYARMGRDRLIAAGHMVYWHEFDGGHTTNAMFSLTMFDDLASSRAPLSGM